MAEIARWNGHKFEVGSGLIRGFTGLSIKGSSETEDKTSDKQKYVSRKNGKPNEITLTAILNAATGCDVKKEAMDFVNEARAGNKDYFYVATKKLCTCQVMLTEATVKEIAMTNKGVWTRAEVTLTLKQCDKNGSTSSEKKTTSTTPAKQSVKTTSTTSSNILTKVADAVKTTVQKVTTTAVKTAVTAATTASNLKTAISKAQTAISKITTAAKAATTAKKTTSTGNTASKSGGGSAKVVKAVK